MSTRRRRLSETLLRWVVRDPDVYEGMLGDLREERSRRRDGAQQRRAEPQYDRAVIGLAGSYLVDRFRRRCRDDAPNGRAKKGNGRGIWGAAAADMRAAAVLITRKPAFSLAVIATLGLGFGTAAAVLSFAYGVWLKPLPFPDEDALVRLYEVKIEDDGNLAGNIEIRPSAVVEDIARRSRLSPPLLEDLRDTRLSSLVEVAAVSIVAYDWTRDATSERLAAISASRGIFEVLGLRPIAGRWFSDTRGSREVVLTEDFWQRAFGADPEIVGTRTLVLDGESHLIVGVVDDDLPYPERQADIWTPFDPSANELSEGMRGARYLDVVARLRPGAPLAAAGEELDAFVRSLGREHPNHEGWGATAVLLRQDLVRPFLSILRLLLTGAAMFLLIACSNAAGLVAARRIKDGAERRLRVALGASRMQMMRQEITEALLIGASAGVVAVVLANVSMAPLRHLAPADIPRIANIGIDGSVMMVLGICTVVTAVLVAMIGGAMSGRERSLRVTHYATGAPATGGRSSLVVGQVALTTLLLLTGTALALHFRQLARIEPGFVADDVSVASLVLSQRAYVSDAQRLGFFEAAIDGLTQRGHEVAFGVNPPIAGSTMRFGYRAGETTGSGPAEQHWGQYHVVSEHYFELLGIPLLSGRIFNNEDRAESLPVVIVNETLARAHFDDDPVGREMVVVGTSRQIVGVVASVHHFGPDRQPPAEMYVPLPQDPWLLGHVIVRPGEGYSLGDLREVVSAIDPTVPAPPFAAYDDFVRTWFAPLRFQLTVVGLLAAAGSLLAFVGLYTLIAYVFAGRVREIGIRLALGESSRSVFARVVVRGLTLATGGVACGMLVAWAFVDLLSALSTPIEATNLAILSFVAGLVLVAALMASAWPARHAARVDPVGALRRD